jgi:hypothetical protein
MTKNVTVTITNAGSNSGPFTLLFLDSDGDTVYTINNVTLSALTAGYLATGVPTSAIDVKIESTAGLCEGTNTTVEINIP